MSSACVILLNGSQAGSQKFVVRSAEYLIFIIGGGTGLMLNYYVTSSLLKINFEFWYAYTLGTILNIIFNFLYHWLITFGIQIRLRAAFARFTVLSLVAWFLNIFVTSLIVDNYNISTDLVIFIAVSLMSIGNYLLSSTYIFSSTIAPQDALDRLEKIYSSVPLDFYDLQQSSQNPIRSWFHLKRQSLISENVMAFLEGKQDDPVIVDLGCGNCAWNADQFPVIGVDMNEYLMDYALERGRLTKKILSPIHDTGLPDQYADVVIISEVVEHLIDPIPALQEIDRILKKDGKVLVTVPYDTILSMWKPLFTMQCFLHGTIKRSYYYLNKCGHVKAYSPKSIRNLLERYFHVDSQSSMKRFSIFTICSKKNT